MHPNFLREEAARFRGMAETVGQEDSKLRLLKMAADYLAEADAKDVKLTEVTSAEVISGIRNSASTIISRWSIRVGSAASIRLAR